MKTTKNSLVIRYSLAIVSLLGMACFWGFVLAPRAGIVPGFLEIFIFVLILIVLVHSFVVKMKKLKDIESGFPEEDELSKQVKYRAGYYSFMSSIYVWASLWVLKEIFTDYDTLFGLGVLLPAVIFIVLRSYFTRNPHENSH
jgi:hypothetical protein